MITQRTTHQPAATTIPDLYSRVRPRLYSPVVHMALPCGHSENVYDVDDAPCPLFHLTTAQAVTPRNLTLLGTR